MTLCIGLTIPRTKTGNLMNSTGRIMMSSDCSQKWLDMKESIFCKQSTKEEFLQLLKEMNIVVIIWFITLFFPENKSSLTRQSICLRMRLTRKTIRAIRHFTLPALLVTLRLSRYCSLSRMHLLHQFPVDQANKVLDKESKCALLTKKGFFLYT